MQNTSNEGLTEQRKEHTLRTIEAIGILKDAFKEIDRLNLENQELRNALLMAKSIKAR